ncbi:sulfurtransferase TusA family protein [Methylophaga sulfidovorans]|uniref:TusA-related sulfurtransferase n=1 Tax=Methylophaga sulfidovorans TaxID=45496 RepID=A0A1I3UUM7_9GAMM|nr:sulfurtransferase TusA family protein [Methylophaga sulfidovorans]SFJ87064.1 TusA-related sulfurtransferase [Methylophaga sulfidovorans]
MSKQILDARKMLCPLPVIKAQNQIKLMSQGEELDVICTDPGALHDIPAWARINGHEVIATQQNDDELVITVRVGA